MPYKFSKASRQFRNAAERRKTIHLGFYPFPKYFHRIVFRRVGRQIKKTYFFMPFEILLNLFGFVNARVIQDDDYPFIRCPLAQLSQKPNELLAVTPV